MTDDSPANSGLCTVTKYNSYIICTSPRSGSTLLCKLLAATDISGKPDSHFHNPSISAWMEYYNISFDCFTDNKEILLAIFRSAIDRGTGNTGVFGLRLQQHSFGYFMQKLRCLSKRRCADSDFEHITEVFGKTLLIHLTRENKLNQAISLEKAIQTGLWHQAPDGTEIERTTAPRAPVYNAKAIKSHMKELVEMETAWDTWFTETGLNPLRITYDDLSENPGDTLARVLLQLGLDPAVADNIAIPVKKLADSTNHLWAECFPDEK